MNSIYKWVVKPIFFLLEPEVAHRFILFLFRFILKVPLLSRWTRSQFSFDSPKLSVNLLGLAFKNPLGLAAGFDKNGEYIDLLAELGFGFIEVGTVTPKPQLGNEKPRLFRLLKDRALINRMGFNNHGVDALVKNLKNRKNKEIIIGGNIGKNKNTPNEDAHADYVMCFNKLHLLVDYFVVNVSSPNTPNLRELQEKDKLHKILSSIQIINLSLSKPKPILVKISPDINEDQLNDIMDTIMDNKIDGIVATNTTIGRDNLNTEPKKIKHIGIGGLSGAPLFSKTNSWIKYLDKNLDYSLAIIGVGGILSCKDAEDHIESGADLIQVYTGLIYKGPGFIKEILTSLGSKG